MRTGEPISAAPMLLLCPPGSRVFQRDNYCSHESKASYYWYPYDLVVQSGLLRAAGPVEVLDATARRLNAQEALDRLAGRRFRAILALTGAVCWSEDESFLRHVHELTGAPIYLTGDLVSAHPRRAMERLSFAAGVLRDYTSPALVQHLEGDRTQNGALVLRGEKAVPSQPVMVSGRYAIPVPLWPQFPPEGYRLPFLRRRPFASVAGSFGCPHACAFCTAAPLPWKLRDLDNLFEELRYLSRAGYREIHFKDLSFGVDPAFYMELLDRLANEKLGFEFNCLARADSLTPELLRTMRRAGCRVIHVGVESASQATLERVSKGVTLEGVRAALDDCRRVGIQVIASYVLGLPWESRADLERTISLAVDLDTEYASFNAYVNRTQWPMPNGTGPPDSPRDYDLAAIQNLAYRRFYFRPSYLLRKLRTPLTLTGLGLASASGWELFRRHVVPGFWGAASGGRRGPVT